MLSFKTNFHHKVTNVCVSDAHDIPAAAAVVFEYMLGYQFPANLNDIARDLREHMESEGAIVEYSPMIPGAEGDDVTINNSAFGSRLVVYRDWNECVERLVYTTGGGRIILVDNSEMVIDFGEEGSTNFADLCMRALLGIEQLPYIDNLVEMVIAFSPEREELVAFNHVFPTASNFRAPLWLHSSCNLATIGEPRINFPPPVVSSVAEAIAWLICPVEDGEDIIYSLGGEEDHAAQVESGMVGDAVLGYSPRYHEFFLLSPNGHWEIPTIIVV